MGKYAKTTPYARNQKIVFCLLGAMFALFFAYVYFVSASIVHVIVRKEIEQKIATVSTHISDLESRYIEAKDEFTETHLANRGFTLESPEKIYITKTPSSLVLASQNEI